MRRHFHEKDVLREEDRHSSSSENEGEGSSRYSQRDGQRYGQQDGWSFFRGQQSHRAHARAHGSDFMTTMLSRADISPKTQRHLVRVYGNLAATTATAALAAFLCTRNVLPDAGGLAFFGSVGLLFAISALRGRVGYRARLAMLLGFGFMQGWEAGPLVQTVLDCEPETVLMALVGTLFAFVSFSATALFSPRRSHLYLGGLLGTLSLMLFFSSFISRLFSVNLYLGLFIVCAYVIYDTQVIVERAELGDCDDVHGAVSLFTDLFGAFVRLLVILQRGKGSRERELKRERERRRK